MSTLTRKQDKLLRRAIRDTGCPRNKDVLSESELKTRISYWREELWNGTIPSDTCYRMIALYKSQLYKEGVNGVASVNSAAY